MERDKWEVDNLDGNNKPGMESIYPKWFVVLLIFLILSVLKQRLLNENHTDY